MSKGIMIASDMDYFCCVCLHKHTLGIEPRASCMLGKRSTTELYTQPLTMTFVVLYLLVEKWVGGE
jgi:hypothetical protein